MDLIEWIVFFYTYKNMYVCVCVKVSIQLLAIDTYHTDKYVFLGNGDGRLIFSLYNLMFKFLQAYIIFFIKGEKLKVQLKVTKKFCQMQKQNLQNFFLSLNFILFYENPERGTFSCIASYQETYFVCILGMWCYQLYSQSKV